MSVENWRKKVDEVDAALLLLLNQRAGYSREIGLIKKELGLAGYDQSREQEILEALEALNRGPLSDKAVHRLFERILDESRRLVEQVLLEHQAQQASRATENTR